MVNTPLIFYGPDYESALAKAKAFAVKLLGKDVGHPDFFELQLDGKNYTKEQIVEFLSDVALAPYEATYKVYLFHKADKMLPVHANALLKTFEEKPNHAAILLVTDNIKAILETIQSRCKKIYAPKIASETTPVTEAQTRKALLQIAKNELYACLDTLSEIEEANLSEITETVFTWYRDLNLLKVGLPKENLIYPETQEAFNHLKEIPPLEEVAEWIKQASIAAERHMRLKLILEYLFLKPCTV